MAYASSRIQASYGTVKRVLSEVCIQHVQIHSAIHNIVLYSEVPQTQKSYSHFVEYCCDRGSLNE